MEPRAAPADPDGANADAADNAAALPRKATEARAVRTDPDGLAEEAGDGAESSTSRPETTVPRKRNGRPNKQAAPLLVGSTERTNRARTGVVTV
jgi:hypothetical protein